MRHFKITIILVSILLSFGAMGQDALSSQPFTMPLDNNPAIMGANQDLYVNVGYRSQWVGIDDGYQTMKFTALCPILYNKQNMGKLDGGISAYNDKAGAFSTTNISLAMGYDINLDKNNHLSASLLGGYINKSLDAESLIWGDQYIHGSYSETNSSVQNIDPENAGIVDAGFGLMWYYQPENDSIYAYAGFSGYHFYGPEEGFVSNSKAILEPRYSAMAGLKFITSLGLDVSPNFTIQHQAGATNLAMGVNLEYKFNIGASATTPDMLNASDEESKSVVTTNSSISLGTLYRERSNTFVWMFGFQYDMYAIGYSYDFAPKGIKETAFEASTHEITLAFRMNRTGSRTISPYSLW